LENYKANKFYVEYIGAPSYRTNFCDVGGSNFKYPINPFE